MSDTRRDALLHLVRLDLPLDEAIRELSAYPFDSEEELVDFGRVEALSALARASDLGLSAAQIEAWADAIEVRDDIRITDDLVSDLVFELANPLLAVPIDSATLLSWRARLGATP